VIEAVRDAVVGAHTYPKASHSDLTAALAEEWDFAHEQVWLASGANGALDLLARAFLESGDRIPIPDPGFTYYGMSAQYTQATVDTHPLPKSEDFRQDPDRILHSYDGHRIVYITSPHSPIGSEIGRDVILDIADQTDSQTLVVVDKAYGEFSAEPSSRPLLDSRPDVAVLRTFSKAYGLAGLRVGYAMVPEEWADAYELVNTPFAVNSLACHAGLAALEDHEHVERIVKATVWAREYLQDEPPTQTWESGGNFVLVDVGDAEAVTAVAQRQGVIVRDCSSFGLPGCIRISCGTRLETREAVSVLNDVLAERGMAGTNA